MVFVSTRVAAELVPTVHVAVAYLKFCIPNLNLKMPPYCSTDLSYNPQNRSFSNAFKSPQIKLKKKKIGNCLETFFVENYITQRTLTLYNSQFSFLSLSLSHGSHLALNIKRGNMSENLPI